MKTQIKKTAVTGAIALLTAASVVTGSLFDSPAALLPEDGAPNIVYNMTTGLDGADGDDAGAQEGENEEKNRRGGIRAALRARILRLPLIVRLLVVLPLWALGSALLAAAGAAWALLQPVLGQIAGFAVMLALLLGAFAAAMKAVFPDLPLRKLFGRRSLVGLLLGASALTVADAALPAVWAEYAQMKSIVLSAGFFVALCCVTVPFALREQKRRLKGRAKGTRETAEASTLTFTDAGGTFTVRVPNVGR